MRCLQVLGSHDEGWETSSFYTEETMEEVLETRDWFECEKVEDLAGHGEWTEVWLVNTRDGPLYFFVAAPREVSAPSGIQTTDGR